MPIDINPTAAALQNSFAVNQLMQPTAQTQQLQQQILQHVFATKQMQLQAQLEMQRQANAQAFQSAQLGREEDFQSGENRKSREQASTLAYNAITADKDRLLTSIQGNKELAKQGEESQAALQSTAQKAESAREMAHQTQIRADMIRQDPRAQQLGIDLSKYNPDDPSDNQKLVQDFSAKATPAALEKLDADKLARMQSQIKTSQSQVMNYPNTVEGRAVMVQRLLQDPTVTTLLTNDANTRWTAADFQKVARTGDLDTLTNAMARTAQGYLFGRDKPNILLVQTAMQNARQSLFTQPTPTVANNLGIMQDLSQRAASVFNQGNITTPQGFQTAFGSSTPVADSLKAAAPQPAPAGAVSPVLPPQPTVAPVDPMSGVVQPAPAGAIQAAPVAPQMNRYGTAIPTPLPPQPYVNRYGGVINPYAPSL